MERHFAGSDGDHQYSDTSERDALPRGEDRYDCERVCQWLIQPHAQNTEIF